MSFWSGWVLLALTGVDADAEVIGHVAWSNAARGANRLAAFYSSLFDLPPRLVDPAWMRARFDAEYSLLATGAIAIDRPLGVVFVATNHGGIERIEFGYAPSPRAPEAATNEPIAELTAAPGTIELSNSDPVVVAVVAPYLRTIEFPRDDRAIDLSARIDLAAIERRCLPAARAWATVAALLLPDDDPRREWLVRADAWATVLSRESSSLDLGVRFESTTLALSLEVAPVADSRFERLLERTYPIELATYSSVEPGIGLLGELGVDRQLLLDAWTDEWPARGTVEDRSGGPTRIRMRLGVDSDAWIVTASCREDDPVSGAADAPATTIEWIRSGDECGYVLGNLALARAPLAPWIATRIPFVQEPAFDPTRTLIGALEFSLPASTSESRRARSGSERLSRAWVSRGSNRLSVELRLPIAEIAASIPRFELDAR